MSTKNTAKTELLKYVFPSAGEEEKHGTLECRKLLDGADLMTPEGQERFKSENMKKDRCTIFVKDAVEILEGII